MKKRVFKPLLRTSDEEITDAPSLTEQNQVKPLEVLLRHRMQGIPVDEFRGEYSDNDYPDLDKMDFEQQYDYRQGLADEIENIQEEIQRTNKAMEAKQRAEAQKLVDAPPEP